MVQNQDLKLQLSYLDLEVTLSLLPFQLFKGYGFEPEKCHNACSISQLGNFQSDNSESTNL